MLIPVISQKMHYICAVFFIGCEQEHRADTSEKNQYTYASTSSTLKDWKISMHTSGKYNNCNNLDIVGQACDMLKNKCILPEEIYKTDLKWNASQNMLFKMGFVEICRYAK